MRKNLVKKKLFEKIIKPFFEASNVPPQSLFLRGEALLNNCRMFNGQDGIKNMVRNLFLGGSKMLGVETL